MSEIIVILFIVYAIIRSGVLLTELKPSSKSGSLFPEPTSNPEDCEYHSMTWIVPNEIGRCFHCGKIMSYDEFRESVPDMVKEILDRQKKSRMDIE